MFTNRLGFTYETLFMVSVLYLRKENPEKAIKNIQTEKFEVDG